MQLVASDILTDARGLTVALTIVGLAAGVFLWLFGWWSHRFWVVLTATVLAGIHGLQEVGAGKTPPLVIGLLLAISAGLLALALVRVLAFGAGGMAGMWVLQSAAPHIDQPLVVFLISGLVGLLLFRVWMMALTSLAGTLLISYAGLCLLDHAGTLDAVQWTAQGEVLLNWLMSFIAVVGLAFQFVMDRRSRRRRLEEEDEEVPPTPLAVIGRAIGLRRAG